jgi:hypothetical protein
MPVPLRVLIAEDSEDEARLVIRVETAAAMAAALERQARDLGSRLGYPQKPFTPEALARRVREALDASGGA